MFSESSLANVLHIQIYTCIMQFHQTARAVTVRCSAEPCYYSSTLPAALHSEYGMLVLCIVI